MVEREAAGSGSERPETCDLCGKFAFWEAWYGPTKQAAELFGTDRPYAQNRTVRCDGHKYTPMPDGQELWRWHCLVSAKRGG